MASPEKCHKTPAIALKESKPAIGVTCAKVSEAEVMAAGGTCDILIANMIVGPRKLERVAAFSGWSRPDYRARSFRAKLRHWPKFAAVTASKSAC